VGSHRYIRFPMTPASASSMVPVHTPVAISAGLAASACNGSQSPRVSSSQLKVAILRGGRDGRIALMRHRRRAMRGHREVGNRFGVQSRGGKIRRSC
jgi:hypothetical protein